ncbi:MAG: 4Fe-4S dicluster domain-containing protein [Dehalococcoidales bacterium]|nr:4Fe-4S dicluster domain-containing protein [Dehalococcoidales bacterium]
MSDLLAKLDARTLKAGGLIKQREKDIFVARIRVAAGNIDADKMIKAAELAKKYGRGFCHFTFQQSIEIPWVKLEDFDSFRRDLDAAGLSLANCGPKVRAITACSGCTINPYGVVDAAGLAAKADERFFGVETPHKFKIAYAGCPIGCPNPQGNDLGFHGMVEPELHADLCNGCSLCVTLCNSRGNGALKMSEETQLPERDLEKCIYCGECIVGCPTEAWVAKRVGHAVYVGGKHGRFPRWADRVADFVSDEETFELIERVVQWYREHGKRGERIGYTIDRLGLEKFRREVCGDRFTTAHTWNARGDRPVLESEAARE